MPAHSKSVQHNVQVADLICNEIPSGVIDGSNVTFTLAHTPVLGTVQIDLNGIVQSPGSGKDYTIAVNVITFIKAPRANSEILAHYVKSS